MTWDSSWRFSFSKVCKDDNETMSNEHTYFHTFWAQQNFQTWWLQPHNQNGKTVFNVQLNRKWWHNNPAMTSLSPSPHIKGKEREINCFNSSTRSKPAWYMLWKIVLRAFKELSPPFDSPLLFNGWRRKKLLHNLLCWCKMDEYWPLSKLKTCQWWWWSADW